MPSVANNVLSPQEIASIDQAIAKHGGRPGELLSILEAVQSANPHKYLSMDALRSVAERTGIAPSTVYSTATFYSLFNLEPQGDNVVCVCRGTACHTRGSRALLERLCLDLGLSEHDTGETKDSERIAVTTPDRKFTIRTVACFGQCALAPVAEVNHHIFSHVNERILQREVKALTQGRK